MFNPEEIQSPTAVPVSLGESAKRSKAVVWILGAALVALFLKLAIAYNTFGTNDVVTFYSFARSLSEHGLEWTYRRGVVFLPQGAIFNHPPVPAYFLQFIHGLAHNKMFQENGFTFPFLLRLPGILADFVVVLVLLQMWKTNARFHLPRWALVLFALSPVSLMVSGFHGNTDSVMVMFFVLAAYMCVKERPWMCGLFFALSCQVKIIPLLFFPILFFFWLERRAIVAFLLPFAGTSVVLWLEPLLNFPALFVKNVLSYGSFWGLWGITYWLRVTELPVFSRVSFINFSPAQTIVMTSLKVLIVAIIFAIAWRRRSVDGRGLINSLAYGWLAFFVFSPGVCAQYLVWLAPFILLLSPNFYGWLTATSSLFLFFFYNITGHGLPWYLAVSTNTLNRLWTPWSVWPWAALVLGMIFLWKKATSADPTLRLFSLVRVQPQTPVQADSSSQT